MAVLASSRSLSLSHTRHGGAQLGVQRKAFQPHTPGIHRTARILKPRDIACQAFQTDEGVAYQGVFGPWKIEQIDLVEVWSYRVGISVAAAGYLYAGAYGLFPQELSSLRGGLDAACLVGALGLGASLQLIHIYVAVLKRALQAMWAVGLLGGIYIAATQDAPVAVFVADNPQYMWLVGPMFAALTGVAFKEGFCYNKWEAAGLFGAVPLLTGGHLLGIWSTDAERGLLASTMVLLAVFAGRKYTQKVKDDIGDKSVFMFQQLPAEQQEALLQKRRALIESDDA